MNALRIGGKTSSVWVKVNSRRNQRELEVFTFQLFPYFCSLLRANRTAGIYSNARTRKATKWGQRIPSDLHTFSFILGQIAKFIFYVSRFDILGSYFARLALDQGLSLRTPVLVV